MNSNSKRYLSSLFLLAGIAAPMAAMSAPSVNDRVGQLERIANAHSQVINQLQQEVASTHLDIDQLRGQIETNQHQLNQVIERQKQLYLHLEELSGKVGGGATSTATAAAVSTNVATAGTTSTVATPEPTAKVVQANATDEDSAYKQAISLVMEQKKYDEAIVAFRSFLKTYPKSQKYGANANYWLAQLLYNKGEKADASYYYAVVVKEYPKSEKAADALYKVGILLQEKADFTRAKAIYQQVIKQYPDSATAKSAEKRLQEM